MKIPDLKPSGEGPSRIGMKEAVRWLPIAVKPNAGLPRADGSYDLDAKGFAEGITQLISCQPAWSPSTQGCAPTSKLKCSAQQNLKEATDGPQLLKPGSLLCSLLLLLLHQLHLSSSGSRSQRLGASERFKERQENPTWLGGWVALRREGICCDFQEGN